MEKFNFTMPAEIVKSKDGEYKIAGLASTEDVDQQQEVIIQKGIDLTPVDEGKGFFNFDHSNRPEDLIGTVDGYHRDAKGLYVHGKLFKGHERAEAVYAIMKGLGERKRGAVGLSVEGQILERDTSNPKVIKKCRIKNVAVTFSPVNKNTYADLMKSMSADAEVEFEATKENLETNGDEQDPQATFTANQVMAIVQKALGVGAGYTQAPVDRSGGDAMATSDMKAEEKKKKKEEPEVQGEQKAYKMKKMAKSEFAKSLTSILDKLQVLYPENSRSELWEAVKDRLDTKFPAIHKGLRLKQTTAKEREHKLYEDARQRSDYEDNKDKSRQQLAETARESGAPAKERAQIRAQADAAKQVGDRDHVRPGVRG